MLSYEFEHFKLYFHKTHEIIKLVKKPIIVVAMNVQNTALNRMKAKHDSIIITSSLDLATAKNVFLNHSVHCKIYVTDKSIFISSANCSLSSLYELTIEFPKGVVEDQVLEIVNFLKSKSVNLRPT